MSAASAVQSRRRRIIGYVVAAIIVVSGLCLAGVELRRFIHRDASARQLRSIGLALRMYANEYGHAYPPDLATLARTEDLTTYVFIAPSQHCVAPENRDARGEWTKIVPGSLNCTYFYPYRPDFTDQMAANSVVLYEPQALNDGRGANVLYADGHTKWLDAKTATTVISQVEAGINPPK